MKTLLSILALAAIAMVQDKPEIIAKKDLPKEAECAVCTATGAGHEAEKPVAGAMYKGKHTTSAMRRR